MPTLRLIAMASLLAMVPSAAGAQHDRWEEAVVAVDWLPGALVVTEIAPASTASVLGTPSTSARRRLGPDAAALIGGVAGAVAGYGLMKFVCRNRYCEMGDLVGIVLGAVVGSSIGHVLAGGEIPGRRRGG